ncbi:phosphatase PAP2 family protein [Truepera radiovictrix]|uniref:Phosphoesterase PA-phosphatase related protein n=1 Tax=Truepera radiovictrix (strain DSM 17093 / CIP 108686 / LMG 22925 / RQ-24) TaxID=649638 RepID=D7CU59_TRURR|nr:phosphatase PAP2 family protein [Truepera radiovictrix]ADI13957.1 phosphoesterase PA-phosphatase related protein [Truepera radiovictrix DSM 17093]WMT57479.1 phosphatase PAP2 family protein [Truepera radiovictrix]
MDTVLFLQSFASPALDRFFQLVTDLGSEGAYIVLLLSVYLALDARLGQRLGVFVLVTFFVNFHLKGLVGTPRPFELDPALGRTPEAVAGALGPGFPSAHAQSSLTFWGYAALWLRRRWFWALALALVALVSLSRLYLGVHVLADVLGGLALGALFLGLVRAAEPLWGRLQGVPKGARVALGVLAPLALMLLLPPPGLEPDLILGALAAFLTAPLLAPYAPPRALWQRLVAAAFGVALVFAALLLSSLLLPEALKRDPLGGFARYLVIGYAGLLLVPALVSWVWPRVKVVRAAD